MSSDGFTWTAQAQVLDKSANNAVYAFDKWWAVGEGSKPRAVANQNAQIWTDSNAVQPFAPEATWITFHETLNLLVAVGKGGARIASSANGTVWQSSPFSGFQGGSNTVAWRQTLTSQGTPSSYFNESVTVSVNDTLVVSGNVTVDGNLIVIGSLVLTGSANLTIHGNATFDGVLSISSDAVLMVDGTTTFKANSTLNVVINDKLEGSGSLLVIVASFDIASGSFANATVDYHGGGCFELNSPFLNYATGSLSALIGFRPASDCVSENSQEVAIPSDFPVGIIVGICVGVVALGVIFAIFIVWAVQEKRREAISKVGGPNPEG